MPDLKLSWEKCPAVITGGKDSFYTTVIKDRRYWVAWNKLSLCYEVSTDEAGYPILKRGFKTANAGMKYVEGIE